MKLPGVVKKFFPGSSKKPNYLLSLILREEEIKASVYSELDGTISRLGEGREDLGRFIDELDITELLEAADRAIGMAEDTLPQEAQASKTIFGINESWQQNGKIIPKYLEKLRRLKEDLELEPIGFVVIPEAISYLLQSEEGAPINAVIVELEKTIMTVSLIRASRVAESKHIDITSEQIPVLVEKALKGFSNFEVLPSRIILFNSKIDLEDIKQQCISFSWTKSLPFLHVPRIEILQVGIDEKAVVLGIAREMGLTFGEPERETQEVSSKEPLAKKEAEEVMDAQDESLAFGFLKEDYGEKKQATEPIAQEPVASKPESGLGIGEKLRNFWDAIPVPPIPSISLENMTNPLGASKRFFLVPFIIILLVLLYVGAYLFFTKAKVEAIVQAKVIELEKDIILDATLATPDLRGERVKGEIVSVTKEGNKTGSATGKKAVGDKAKGEVKIGNRTELAKTFPKGTVIVGPNSLKFALLESTAIASPSPGSFDIPNVKAQVEAVQIGEESNLSANANFSFADFGTASYFAKNEAPFTGGSKREIVVVTKADQDSLSSSLSGTLKEQALSQLSKNNDKLTIVDTTSEKILEKKFDRKVDEETKSFSVSEKIEYQAIGYQEKELKKFFTSSLSQNIGDTHFTLSENGIELTIKSIEKKKDGTIRVKVHGKASFIPKLDFEDIKSHITFKSSDDIRKMLMTFPNVTDVKVTITPQFPLFPRNSPFFANNITLLESQKKE